MSQIVECARVQLGIFDAGAKRIFDEQGKVHQAERIDQAALNERLIGRDPATRLLEDLRGNVGFETGNDCIGHINFLTMVLMA